MIILGINTATRRTGVALVEVAELAGAGSTSKVAHESRVLFEKSWKSNRDEAEKVLPAVNEALKRLEKPAQKNKNGNASKLIDYIFVIKGPGPFTGLRVGLTIANTLAFVKNIPLISCTTFEYFQTRLPETRQKDTAIILKAGGDFVAVSMPEDLKAKRKPEPKILAAIDLQKFLLKSKISIKFLTGDLDSVAQKNISNGTNSTRGAKVSQGAKFKWIPEKSLLKFSEVIKKFGSHLSRSNPESASMRNSKNSDGLSKTKKGNKSVHVNRFIEPTYLRPPKITASKKEIFTNRE